MKEQLAEQFVSALLAFKKEGGNFETANFLLKNTGIAITLSQRIIDIRKEKIDDIILKHIIEEVYSG